MNETIFNIVTACIPLIGVIITGFVIPYIKQKISAARLDEIIIWVGRAVNAAEVLFDVPGTGDEKRYYVINLIDSMFNRKKEVIAKDQIRILLEAAWKEMTDTPPAVR